MTATQPPREPRLDLGIVVLSFGRAERHRELVDTLIATDRIAPSSIVVVHNAFAPGDEWLPTAPPGVRVLGTDDNLGYAGGMNLGIRTHLREGRRWVLCLTHEVRLGDGCLAALVAATRERDDLGVIGPVLSHAVTGEVFSSGVMSTRWGVRHRMEVERGTQPVDRDAVDGSAMLVRAAAFEAVGGLDERMFMYWEETEFCLRVRQHGWRVAVATDARAFAEPGGASRTAAHAYLTTRNGLLYASSTRRRGAVPARLARTAYEIWRAIPKPGGRRSRDPAMWRIGAVRSRAAIWGVVDYARGRYGPPPPRLLRGTDIRPTIPAG